MCSAPSGRKQLAFNIGAILVRQSRLPLFIPDRQMLPQGKKAAAIAVFRVITLSVKLLISIDIF
jgi:hypothetical protein